MPINMDVDNSIYWDGKHSALEKDFSSKVNLLMNDNKAPSPSHDQSCYGQCCKDDNSIYQFCYSPRHFNFTANTMSGVTSEEDDYHQSSSKRKISVTRLMQISKMLARNTITQQRVSAYIADQQSIARGTNGTFKRAKKRPEDPMSHRIIEKRRRDRMNNCLADLSRLVPAECLKKGRGRIEKTEIIEMAIKHMKYLQDLTCTTIGTNDVTNGLLTGGIINDKQFVNGAKVNIGNDLSPQEHYKLGYQECVAETMRFLVELQGFFPNDNLCVKLISHLQKYYEQLTKGDKLVSNALENMSPLKESESKSKDYRTHSADINVHDTNKRCDVSSNLINGNGHHNEDGQENNGMHDGVIGSLHGSANSSENGSQLREMLLNPHSNSSYATAVRTNVIRHSSPELSSQNDSSNDNQSSSGSLYKFKNDIRERFEHSKSGSNLQATKCTGNRIRSDTSSNSTKSSFPSNEDFSYMSARSIPIFALHPKGSFYVPLTIDSHLLAPFIADVNCVLHPVTISVNFNRPLIHSLPLSPPSMSFSSRIQNEPPVPMVTGCS